MPLTRDQKVYLIKKVDCHPLTVKRIEALPGYFEKFPGVPSEEDLKEISDFVCINPGTIKTIAEGRKIPEGTTKEGWRS